MKIRKFEISLKERYTISRLKATPLVDGAKKILSFHNSSSIYEEREGDI